MMKKSHLFIFFSLLFVGLAFAIVQYFQTFQAEIASAYDASKPSVGHDWSEMQCTEDMCIDTDNHRVGIGTDSPTEPLDVAGNIVSSGDICIGSGACLSDIEDFVGSQLLINGVHTYSECNNAGGIVVDTSSALKQCRFNTSSCPSGWTQYEHWSETTSQPGPYIYMGSWYCRSTYSGRHAWANNATIETCTYRLTYFPASSPYLSYCNPSCGCAYADDNTTQGCGAGWENYIEGTATAARTAIGCY